MAEIRHPNRPVYHPKQGIVITKEQLEVLEAQIRVYATICLRLVEMCKAESSEEAVTNRDRATSSTSTTTRGRHRWAPSSTQLETLERLFEQELGVTPSKQRVAEITSELKQYGPVSEANVYNWFQNRKARSKRRKHR